jgi:hypothetical protein
MIAYTKTVRPIYKSELHLNEKFKLITISKQKVYKVSQKTHTVIKDR